MHQSILTSDGERLPIRNAVGVSFTHVIVFSLPALPATILWPADPAKRVAVAAPSEQAASMMAVRRAKSTRLIGFEIIKARVQP